MVAVFALAPLAYLIGAFPTAELVARAGGHDVRREGSGNPGASNVFRLMGKRAGALVFAGDIAKGAVPAASGLALWGHRGAYVLGVAAVVGHIYPATRRFRGGRGVATAGGMAIVLYPLVSLALMGVFFVVTAVARRASVASMLIAVGLPVLVWATGNETWEVGVLAGVSALVLARHTPNLRRLLRGEELGLDPSRREQGAS